MDKKSRDFSMDEVQKIAKSPAGQQIAQLLQGVDGTKMQAIADKAAAGDMKSAEKMLQQLLGQENLSHIKNTMGG